MKVQLMGGMIGGVVGGLIGVGALLAYIVIDDWLKMRGWNERHA